jgi:hypothetical protein
MTRGSHERVKRGDTGNLDGLGGRRQCSLASTAAGITARKRQPISLATRRTGGDEAAVVELGITHVRIPSYGIVPNVVLCSTIHCRTVKLHAPTAHVEIRRFEDPKEENRENHQRSIRQCPAAGPRFARLNETSIGKHKHLLDQNGACVSQSASRSNAGRRQPQAGVPAACEIMLPRVFFGSSDLRIFDVAVGDVPLDCERCR